MALKIRLQRKGSNNRPVYKLVVAESTWPRDGRFIEELGHYNPSARGNDPLYQINVDLVAEWVGKGAKPTGTVKSLINKARRTKQEGNAVSVAYNTVATAA